MSTSAYQDQPTTISAAASHGDGATDIRAVFGQIELGLVAVLCLPLVAAIASFQNITIGGINYLAAVTMGTPMVLAILMLVKGALDASRLRLWPGIFMWSLWCAMIWLSLLWTDAPKGDAFKHAFELTTPPIFALAGAMFIREQRHLKLLMDIMLASTLIGLMCIGVWRAGLVELSEFPQGPALDARAHSMSLLLIVAVAIAYFPHRIIVPGLVWSVCLLITGLEGSRGVTLVMLLLPLFHPTFRGLHWKGLALVGIMVMGLIVFYLPPMQARLFPDTHKGTISELFESKQSGMGRFEAWPIILEEAWRRPVLGHGVASAQQYVPTVWDQMRAPHNEYLSVGFEMGWIGLVIFLLVLGYQFRALFKYMKTPQPYSRIGFAAVYLTFVAVCLMALTDNPLSSNVRLLNPTFLLLGASFGAIAAPRIFDEAKRT